MKQSGKIRRPLWLDEGCAINLEVRFWEITFPDGAGPEVDNREIPWNTEVQGELSRAPRLSGTLCLLYPVDAT